jgi:hypothetical protein
MGRTPETGLTWLNGVNSRYALARILMHAVKTEPARFGWFVAFLLVSVRNALRASQGVHVMRYYGNFLII